MTPEQQRKLMAYGMQVIAHELATRKMAAHNRGKIKALMTADIDRRIGDVLAEYEAAHPMGSPPTESEILEELEMKVIWVTRRLT